MKFVGAAIWSITTCITNYHLKANSKTEMKVDILGVDILGS